MKCKCNWCGWIGDWEETDEDEYGKGICPDCGREEDLKEVD